MTSLASGLSASGYPAWMSRYILSPGFQSTAFSISPEFTFCLDARASLNLLHLKHFPLWCFFCGVMTFPFKTSRPANTYSITLSTLGKAVFSPVSFLFWSPPCLMLLLSCWSFLSVFVLILGFDWRLSGSCQNSKHHICIQNGLYTGRGFTSWCLWYRLNIGYMEHA